MKTLKDNNKGFSSKQKRSNDYNFIAVASRLHKCPSVRLSVQLSISIKLLGVSYLKERVDRNKMLSLNGIDGLRHERKWKTDKGFLYKKEYAYKLSFFGH